MTREDVIAIEDYARDRKTHKARVLEIKKNRRLEVGPVCSFYFENFDTIWSQVHEMLYIERGGEAQIADELAAYGTLIPQGSELVTTVMFEIDEPQRRQTFLSKLGGVEETAFLRFAGETVAGKPEEDVDRTTAAGKASSVQFIHFPMTEAQVQAFKEPGQEVVIGFSHPQYAHMAVMPEAVRAALAEDLD
jgi:hypothetical protein